VSVVGLTGLNLIYVVSAVKVLSGSLDCVSCMFMFRLVAYSLAVIRYSCLSLMCWAVSTCVDCTVSSATDTVLSCM